MNYKKKIILGSVFTALSFLFSSNAFAKPTPVGSITDESGLYISGMYRYNFFHPGSKVDAGEDATTTAKIWSFNEKTEANAGTGTATIEGYQPKYKGCVLCGAGIAVGYSVGGTSRLEIAYDRNIFIHDDEGYQNNKDAPQYMLLYRKEAVTEGAFVIRQKEINVSSLMFNAYYDFSSDDYPVHPYIGFGLGWDRVGGYYDSEDKEQGTSHLGLQGKLGVTLDLFDSSEMSVKFFTEAGYHQVGLYWPFGDNQLKIEKIKPNKVINTANMTTPAELSPAATTAHVEQKIAFFSILAGVRFQM